MSRPHNPILFKGWARLLASGCALVLVLAAGCKDREKTIILPPPDYAGPAQFGAPAALDLPPSSPTSAVNFVPSRNVAISSNGDALIVYTGDNGTGTIRMNVVRYDHSRNPIVRYFVSPQTFDANSGNVLDAKILADGQGDGLLVWIQVFNALPRLFASAYQASSSAFSPPQMIDAGGENATPEGVSGFDAALDASGNAVIGFYENPAAPGVCEAFGVHYTKATCSFTSPEKVSLPSYSSPGHTVEGMIALAGPTGQGYLLIMQDSDPGPGSVIHFSVSRFSSESSLSSFNAVTRVNPPGYDGGVQEVDGAILPDGDGLFLYRQPDPVSGRSRVWARVFDSGLKAFTEGFPWDLAPEATSANLDFEDPVLEARSDGLAVAIFRSAPAGGGVLHANVFRPETRTFDSTHSVAISAPGGPVAGGFRFFFAPSGSGEAAYEQAISVSGASSRLLASRFDGITRSFGTPRYCDLGAVETGSISSLPMSYSNPAIAGGGFDGSGRFLVAFTGSDGDLHRLYVNRAAAADPSRFDGARPVDGSTRSSVYSASQTRSEVVDGDAVLVLDASGEGGVAVWRNSEISGGNTSVRLFGNSYHGYNKAPGRALTGAQIVDEHPDATGNAPVKFYDGAATATGSVLALAQNTGGSDELYIRTFHGREQQFDGAGLPTLDNGTTGDIHGVDAVAGQNDDAFVFFLQDDGTGTVHLYGRRIRGSDGTVFSLRGPAVNVALSNTGSGFGSVDRLVARQAGGRALVAFRQAEGGGTGVFGLRVDDDGTVTGPARLSSTTASAVGEVDLCVSGADGTLVLFHEGQDLMARISMAGSFGIAPVGSPDAVESGTAPVGAFDACADGFGNFLVVFESGAVGSGSSVLFRRFHAVSNLWESGPLSVSSQGTATIDYFEPRVRSASNGKAMVLFKARDLGSTPTDVSWMAVTFNPGYTTPIASPVAVDTDGTSLNGLDVDAADMVVEPLSGRGFIAFTQDVDPAAGMRNRLFVRGFDLSKVGSGSPVYDLTVMDMSEGGASTATAVSQFKAAVGADGRGFLVHMEVIPGGLNDTVHHLYARTFEAETLVFGSATLASRMMNLGSGNLTGESVDGGLPVMGADGRAYLFHAVSQTDTGTSTTYRRLFANVYR